jgi:DNA-binding transcriptional regulator LsrR (DeoR family)
VINRLISLPHSAARIASTLRLPPAIPTERGTVLSCSRVIPTTLSSKAEGIGNPQAEIHANRLTSRFADLVGGEAVYLPSPGINGSEAALQVMLGDYYIQNVVQSFSQVTMVLVGIGAIEPSRLLADSGNSFTQAELDLLRREGAVGDILLRFFDSHGLPVKTPLDSRVVSMRLEQLQKVDRSIGVAGGKRKHAAILGALRGGWINILVTDHATARWLLK